MARGRSRVGIDAAGGVAVDAIVPTVFCNGVPVVVLGARVAAHGKPPHAPLPPMVTASSTVFAGGIPVVRAGDSAACGHPISGSDNVFVGD
jgi:uncharacterized Zn-binding protein involved in type VI secretion